MNARKAALLAVFAAVAAAFFLLDLGRYLSLESLKGNRAALEALRDRHAFLFPALFTLVYVFQTAFSLPGAAILSLAAGALFGLVQGTLLAVTGATVGAILAFWVSRTLLRDWAVKKLGGRMEAVDRGLREKGLSYLLFLRLVPVFPFFLVNLACGVTGLPLRTYALGTFFGIIPGGAVYVNAGASLATVESLAQVASPRVLASFAFLGLFALLPAIVSSVKKRRRDGALLKALMIVAVAASAAAAAPEADPWTVWETHDPRGEIRVDHAEWDRFLRKYLVTDHPSGIHRVRYGSVTPDDRKALGDYLRGLEGTEVSRLDREEQKAYWINLYNALTVMVVLDRYPVKSIRDIDISPGLFRGGPWGAKLLAIQGRKVSLDDIEHRILRPLWKDSRVHYALNCASLGCPNLQPAAYTPANTEALLEKGAREFVNHPRGVRLEGNRLRLSSIYRWFRSDFGGSEESVLRHLRKHAEPGLSEKLAEFRGKVSYDYDWRINEP